MDKDNGGSIFPIPNANWFGLTKRDYFAGQYLSTFRIGPGPDAFTAAQVAEKCAAVADAMLAELAK